MTSSILRRTLIATGAALALGVAALPSAIAQSKTLLRISTPAVPDDWHGKMWTVFKESLDKSAPGEFDVQINLNASLFKQGTEPAAMARGNLELSSISAFDIAKIVPEFSIFTAGYVIRDPEHQQKVFNGPIGAGDVQARSADKMDVTILTPMLPRHAPAQPARGAQRQDAGRPQGREAAHARQQGVAVPGRGAGRHRHAAGLRRGLPGPEDRHHRRPGQPAAHRARRQVLRGHQADRADQPPGGRHLHRHLQQGLERDERRRRQPEGAGRRRRLRPHTTTRTASRKKARSWTSSSSRACR